MGYCGGPGMLGKCEEDFKANEAVEDAALLNGLKSTIILQMENTQRKLSSTLILSSVIFCSQLWTLDVNFIRKEIAL